MHLSANYAHAHRDVSIIAPYLYVAMFSMISGSIFIAVQLYKTIYG